MHRIGMVNVGQSPEEDLIPFLRGAFTRPVEVIERGILDDLDAEGIAALGPDPGEVGIVSKLRDGSLTLLSHPKTVPAVQRVADRLVGEGAQVVVILCGADWSAIRSPALVVNPGKLFPSIISSLARDRRLGIIKPSPGQVERERKRYADLGIEAVVTAAPPSTDENRLAAAREAASFLRSRDVDLVWMTCVGMDQAMKTVVEEVVDKPVILARTLLAGVLNELVPTVGLALSARSL